MQGARGNIGNTGFGMSLGHKVNGNCREPMEGLYLNSL